MQRTMGNGGKRRTQMCTLERHLYVHRTLHALFVKPCSGQSPFMKCFENSVGLLK